MSTKKILVIEDNAKHLDDAKAFFADKPEYEVTYMSSGNEFYRLVSKPGSVVCDGVITDLFFPWDTEHYPLEVPAGMGVVMLCREKGIPCVVNTSGGGHGQKSRWATETLMHLHVDTVQAGAGDDEVATKDWTEALVWLKYHMDKPKS